MMAIKAKIHAAHAASDGARIELTAATAYLDVGNLAAVDAHLARAVDAFDHARRQVVDARKHAAVLRSRRSEGDDAHYDPSAPGYDWSAAADAACSGVR